MRIFTVFLFYILGNSCAIHIDNTFHPSLAAPTSAEIQTWKWTLSGIASSGISSNNQPIIQLENSTANGGSVQVYDDPNCTSKQGSLGTISGGSAVLSEIVYETDGSEDGVKTFYVTVSTNTGQTSECTAIQLSYTLDTQPPSIPTIQSWTWGMSSPSNGASSTDGTPVITLGSAADEEGASVQIYDNASCSSEKGASQTISNGATTHGDIAYSASQEGNKAFYTVVTDQAGNTSSCVDISLAYFYDLGPPNGPVIQSWTWTLTGPTNGGISNDTSPNITLTGAAEEGGQVQIYDDASCSNSKGAAQTISGGGTSHTDISYTTGGGQDGVKAFYVKVTDAALNSSSCVDISLGYTLDTVAPNTPTSPSFPSWITSTTSAGSLTWSDGGGATSYFQVAMGTSTGATDTVGWTTATSPHTFSSLSLTECTTYHISIRAIDFGGNISNALTSIQFRADATPPPTPSGIATATDAFISRAAKISWTASSDNCQLDHYKFAFGTSSGGTQTMSYRNIGTVTTYQAKNGTDSLSFNLVPDRNYYSSIKAIDQAGNESSVGTSSAWNFTCVDPMSSHTLLARYDSSDPSTIIDENGHDANHASFTGNVDKWHDLSGNGNHVTAPSASARPTYHADSGAAPASQKDSYVQSDGTDDTLSIDIADVTADFTFFIVFAALNSSPLDYEAFFSNANSPSLTGSWQYNVRVNDGACPGTSSNPKLGLNINDSSSGGLVCGTSNYNLNPHAAVVRYNSSTGVMTYSLDGIQEGSYTWTNSAIFRELRLFRNRFGNRYLNAKIKELALITSSVSSDQDTQIGEYLSCKWNVTY